MLRSDDVADKTFTMTRLREGYEIAEVDCFRVDVAEAIALRDKVISELQQELAAARARPAEAAVEVEVDQGSHDRSRRESSAAAARLLELATVNADQLVADAQAEAERVAAEVDEHRTTVLAEVADRKAALEAKLVSLRQLESEHRNRLRRHFTEQLAQLEEATPAAPLAAVAD